MTVLDQRPPVRVLFLPLWSGYARGDQPFGSLMHRRALLMSAALASSPVAALGWKPDIDAVPAALDARWSFPTVRHSASDCCLCRSRVACSVQHVRKTEQGHNLADT
jgi:hypothetical protein